MDSRRNFVGKVAYGLAGTLAAGRGRVLGANERVRVGIIGAGDRGMKLVNHLRVCPNTEVVAFADIYEKHLDRATGLLTGATGHRDYRELLDARDLDAVVIATPQHLHGTQFRDAIGAGKHVYLEKTAAFTVADAKQMRSAFRASTKVVQIGHQACSNGHVSDVEQFLSDPQRLGKITAIQMQQHRNTPYGKPQWSRPAMLNEMNEGAVEWAAFDPRGFDANRFVHWRMFWDYSGGTVFEQMSQQLAFWYKTLRLEIPRSATMQGGTYLWKDGREVPDTVSVTLEQPEDLMISWVSGLGNNQNGITEDLLGTNGTISRAAQVRYTPQKVNRPDLKELIGRTPHTPTAHMQSFLDAIRSGSEPSCPFDLGYRVSIACRMAVESFRQGRTVRWDARREEIV